MKKTLLLTVVFFILVCNCTLAQKLHPDYKGNKPSESPSKSINLVISELIQSLQKTNKVVKKVDILYEIAGSYLDSLKVDSALFYAQKIKLLSDSNGYLPGLGKYHLAKGIALFLRNKGDEAKQNLQQAIICFTKYKDNLFLGLSYHQLARQLAMKNDYTGAQNYYRQAIPLIATSNDVGRLQWAVHNFGRNFFFTLELDSSVYYLSHAVKLAEQLQSAPKIFNSASMLGAVYLMSDNNKDAEQILSYALAIQLPAVGDKIQMRGVLANYAEALILQNKYEAAIKAINEYDKFNILLGDVSGKMVEKKLKGTLAYRQKNYEAALILLQEAYQLKIDDKLFSHNIMSIAANLGKTELKMDKVDSAVVHFRLVKKLAAQSNYIAYTLEANMLLAEAFQQNNNMDSAYHYFQHYTHLKDSILTFKKERAVIELIAKYDAEKREQQIKNLQTEKQVYSYQLLLKNKTIEQQQLIGLKNLQQLTLLTQQSEISKLQASQKNLALQNTEKEIEKKQNELELLQKEKKLQSVLAAKQTQQKNLLFFITSAIILFALYGAYRYKQNKKLSKLLSQSLTHLKQAQEQLIKTEKEKESENIRVRISRDIHDEVGATLSGVALFSEIAKQKLEQHQHQYALEYLEHISSNSKEMVEKISDIVWAINPDNDSFERITEKLRAYTLNLCAGKGIRLNFEVDDAINKMVPGMELRRNIYLFSKEAINNAIKYSDCNEFLFSLQQKNGYSLLQIKDNGKGFEPTLSINGNGLKNMQARAVELKADFKLNSKPGQGTDINLRFNFHPIGGQNISA